MLPGGKFRYVSAAALILAAGALSGTPAIADTLTATVTTAPAEVSTVPSSVDFMSLPEATPGIAATFRKPAHRLRDGRTTSEASAAAAAAKLESPAANAAVTSSLSTHGFVGLHSKDNAVYGGGEVEPPDQGLAVHTNTTAQGPVAVEIVNDVIQMFNATTGVPLTPPKSIAVFFGDTAASCGDVQAFYDQTINRWIITQLRSSICTTGSTAIEGFDIAISKTSSATGAYSIYHPRSFSSDLSGCAGVDCFPDYPKAGYDANGLYISVDLFQATGAQPFVKAATYAFPKAKLAAGTPITTTRLLYPNDFVVQPSIPAPGQPYVAAANGTEYLIEAVVSGKVRLWAISNTNTLPTTPKLIAKSVDIATQAYGDAVNSTEPNVKVLVCKSKGLPAPYLDGGYTAFQATAQWAHNQLFAALPAGAKDANGLARDTIAWFALKPSVSSAGVPSATVAAQGKVVPAAGYSVSYPAMAVNNTGAGVIGMTIVNKSATAVGGYPSAAVLQFTGTATTGSIMVTGPGVTSDGGFSGCDPSNNVGRWGDYGAAVIDSATGYFYTGAENISGAPGTFSNFGTFITQAH